MSWHRDLSESMRTAAMLLQRNAGQVPDARARIKGWRRGGFPAQSWSTGGRNAETPLPLPDVTDQWLDRWERRYKTLAVSIVKQAQELDRLMTGLMELAPPAPESVVVVCENPACGQELEQGRKSGECGRCRGWRHRHGLAYPKQPAVA